ncbi:deformed epidermal autoregulatory factor 1 isoform X2 [Drosophila nasuta]|uniref:Deformed epidermal autoregulatory factor 1 isoform X2 n=1 Tax=Drosophila albomicans TaxID=7291 RepID=A0A6P8WWY3_DROAB|nr:deformed epidermal autoregulatory factor 1 isoform X2 [Drosophila albomicans]XP_060652513.1 deformed epidermal autoregulatory factor 1 isoform X2 [Drosophila nasuta]
MEQDSTTELHLSRIREVKDLAALTDDVRDVVKEEVILENHHHHQLDTKVRMVTSSSNDNSGSGGGGGAGGAGGGGSAGGGGGNGGGGVVSVPVSLPIGSMITGTAFNVITPDQLPHFKPMLCVDNNGYLSSGAVSMGGDLKTIVIQQQQTQQQQSGNNNAGNTNTTATNTIGLNHDGSGSNNSHDSMGTLDQTAGGGGGGGNGVGGGVGGNTSGSTGWAETTSSTQHMEVFQIRCKTTCAELYRSKLGSGGRGRCVKYKDKWHTPSEFEHVCGRGSSKDWKRSIKYGGKSLQSLIDEGTLTPHATNCSCTVCCDDEAASGPVRLFTPYKRRKRNQTDLDVEPGPKRKRNTHSNNNNNNNNSNTNNNNTSGSSINNNNVDPTQAAAASVVDENNMFLAEDNITSKDEPWAALNDSLDTSTELVDQTQMGNPYERETFVVNINDTGSIAVLDSSQSMKNIEHVYCTMVKATGDFKRLLNEMKQNYERRIEVLQKERDAAVSAMRVQVHTDIDDPNISGSLHGNEIISAKKCANCNREALAECSLCRKTPYCSEFCQRKDWNAHQVECARNPQTTTQQVMLLIDDQS